MAYDQKRAKAVENVKNVINHLVVRLPLPSDRLRLGVERLLVARRRSSALVLVLCLGLIFTLTLTLNNNMTLVCLVFVVLFFPWP